MAGMIHRRCKHCGQGFSVPQSRFDSGRGRYCCVGCYRAHPIPSTESRFWPKVKIGTSCWLWTGSPASKGYCEISLGGSNPVCVGVHRFSYELHFGPIPDGLLVCHECDTPRCVRPDHLFLGTYADNGADCVRKGRAASGVRNGRSLHPECVPRGESHYGAKVTADQVAEIRSLYVPRRVSTRALAERFGLSRSQIFNIVSGAQWRSVL
jgi:hypothetical protein